MSKHKKSVLKKLRRNPALELPDKYYYHVLVVAIIFLWLALLFDNGWIFIPGALAIGYAQQLLIGLDNRPKHVAISAVPIMLAVLIGTVVLEPVRF